MPRRVILPHQPLNQVHRGMKMKERVDDKDVLQLLRDKQAYAEK